MNGGFTAGDFIEEEAYMFSSRVNKTSGSDRDSTEEAVAGRSFVLGTPDNTGLFHIFLDGKVWNINPGPYRAGDRVHVTDVEGEFMTVRLSMQIEDAEEGRRLPR
jgi:membrane protein implicated in regulation of membrane protease activity